MSPRTTSPAAASSASAEASDRARPTTWWPEPSSSGTTAEPMKPDPPVTKSRISNTSTDRCRTLLSWVCQQVMSLADMTVPPMSVTVIRYHLRMGRWQPDARGRLEKAAMELYFERGFDETTVAEIAARAGLTERTFFRHFADKRETLFAGAALLQEVLVQAVVDAPAGVAPGDARL